MKMQHPLLDILDAGSGGGALMLKRSVIQRLRDAQAWCALNGAPNEWIRQLLSDAAQELESESGSLWAQWTIGARGHVRIFVTGEMGSDELDSVLEFLHLQRSFMEKRSEKALAVVAVDPHGCLDVLAAESTKVDNP